MQRVALVFGWYGRGNVGDELMRQALVELFKPRGVTLSFVNQIGMPELRALETGDFVDGVIFGGGSILYGAPLVTPEALNVLLSGVVPVFYAGVGPETEVHPVHQQLLAVAKLVALRDRGMPDLAYSLSAPAHEPSHEPEGILFIPNVETVPTSADPHWAHIAWDRFKDEMCQALDHFIDVGVRPSFLLMCSNNHMEDAWAASELMARMRRRGWRKNVYRAADISTCVLMKRHKVVITQRYHGIIMAEMAGVPYVAIEHHDKLKNVMPHRGQHVSYHGANKRQLIDAIEASLTTKLEPHVVPRQVYDQLADSIVAKMGPAAGG